MDMLRGSEIAKRPNLAAYDSVQPRGHRAPSCRSASYSTMLTAFARLRLRTGPGHRNA